MCDAGRSPRSSLSSTSIDEEEESLLHSVHHRVSPAPAAYEVNTEIGSAPQLGECAGTRAEVGLFQILLPENNFGPDFLFPRG